MEIVRIPSNYYSQIEYLNKDDAEYVFKTIFSLAYWNDIKVEKSLRGWLVLSIWREAIQMENKARAKKWEKRLNEDFATLTADIEAENMRPNNIKSNQVKSSQIKSNQDLSKDKEQSSTDLQKYQSLDAESELTNIMSDYISLEMDLEIMDRLIQNASAVVEYWSAVNNDAITVAANGSITRTNLGFYNSQGAWFQTIGTKINKLSNLVHQKTMRGGINFLVCSPKVATIIESIPGYGADNGVSADDMKYTFGVQKAGQINGKIKVYKNPYMIENTVLLGYKGSQFLETGAVFAPYVPLIMTPLVYDPDTYVPGKGLLTRFAKKMVRPEFYAKLYVAGLDTL